MTDELVKIPIDALDSDDKDELSRIVVEMQNSSNPIIAALLQDQYRKLQRSMEEDI